MSNETGDAALTAEFVADAKALLTSERAEELRQMDLLDPPTPEEMLEAKERLGFGASRLAIVADARDQRRRGRPPGAKNKRTDDFKRWVLASGRHPAAFMVEVYSTPTEVLMDLSGKTYLECLDRQIRCAENIQPYMESKKPVDVNIDATGDFNLIVPGMNISADDADRILAGEDIELGDWIDVESAPIPGEGGSDEPE